MVRACSVSGLAALILAAMAAQAGAETVTLNALSGTGRGVIAWNPSSGGATVGDDARTLDSVVSTYTGKQANKRDIVPIADTTLAAGNNVYSVRVRAYAMSARNMAGTYDGIRVAINVNGVDYRDPAIDELDTVYKFYEHVWGTNPATAAAWTWAQVCSLQAGVITAKTGKSTNTTFSLDYVEVIVTYGYNNTPPTASNVTISGVASAGQTLSGSYSYADAESDPEGVPLFQWFRADSPTDTLKAAIAGATAATYVPSAADSGKYIFFEVTPVAAGGVLIGLPVESVPVGPVEVPTAVADRGGGSDLRQVGWIGAADLLGRSIRTLAAAAATYIVRVAPTQGGEPRAQTRKAGLAR